MKGINRPILMTAADVWAHSYAWRAGVGTLVPKPVQLVPQIPEPVPEPEPVSAPELVPAAILTPEVTVDSVDQTDTEAVVGLLLEKYTKSDLVEFAKAQGLDTEGNKNTLAHRLAAAGFTPFSVE